MAQFDQATHQRRAEVGKVDQCHLGDTSLQRELQ